MKHLQNVLIGIGLLFSATTGAGRAVAADDAAIQEIVVTAERLNQARSSLSPKTGGSITRFDANDIAGLPAGEATSFNQVLLQAPGVANDSFGQIHVRGDHGNLQYRINGVILPEGNTGFGQALDMRFAKRLDLLTGALPAQYGYRTAGVVEIETRSQFDSGGRIDFYGGSRNTLNPGFEYAHSDGNLSYYLTGSYLTSNSGIENPTSGRDALHDRTEQTKAFGYLSYVIDPTKRLTAMVGAYAGKFQIPDNPAQAANPNFLAGAGLAGFDSARLDERQRETNRYGILALQSSIGADFDYQLALFTRSTSVHFTPDPLGDLVFNGIASNVFRSSMSSGVQGDGSYLLNENHTLRMGLFASTENIRADNSSMVFPLDGVGNVSGGATTIVDNRPKNGNRLFGLYLQDEWKANDRLTVNAGIRADRVDALIQAGQLSPRLGLTYKAAAQTTLHAAYARYFTPPPSELVSSESIAPFANTSNAPANTRNAPVQAERSHYFDLGMAHQLTPEISLGIDSFYKRITNLLDEGQFGQALIFSPFNYAKGKIYGIELSVSYKAGNLSAYANLARTTSLATQIDSAQFNFAQNELDTIAGNWAPTDHDQRYTASSGIAYHWSGTELSADAVFGSGLRQGFANSQHLPAYTQINLGATHDFRCAKLGVIEGRLAVINAFDKTYLIRDGSGIGVGAPQFGPRRGVYVGLSKAF